jgi:Ca-activated chloride channel family protein
MSVLDLSLKPRRGALLQGHDTQIDVLVRLAAPEAPPHRPKRDPFNLALVLDRSTSMAGKPIQEAKRCAQFIVESLEPTDRVAVVDFGHDVRIAAPSQMVGNKASLLSAIAVIDSAGNTALHAGWLAGAEEAAAHVGSHAVSRVLLLTDGQANVGERNPGVIAEDCARLAEAGVTTSTYGLGRGFNEDLLAAMARGGGGNGYYGESAEDLMDPFREEFDLLAYLFARKVRVDVAPAEGVHVRPLNALRRDRDGRLILPDIGYSSMGWAMLRVTVPAALAEAGRGDVHVLTVGATYETSTGEPRTCAPAHLRLPRIPAAAFESLAEDQEVAARAREVRSAELQEEVREAAYAGDWRRVDATLAQAQAEAGDNLWLQQSLDALKRLAVLRDTQRLGKEARYKSDKLRTRLTSPNEASGHSIEEELTKPRYARRKPEMGKRMPDDDKPAG